MSTPSGFERAVADRFSFSGPVEIIGHRGFSAEAPENTLAAIQAGIRGGADAVEFDLRAASDGTPVLFHDASLRRTTDGRGAIRRMALDELRELDAGSWFDAEFEGESVPTLAEALSHVADRLPRIYAEIKDVGTAANVDRIAEVASASGALNRIVFIAMDWTLLDRVRAREPNAAVGYIVRDKDELEAAVTRARDDPDAMIDFDKKLLLKSPRVADGTQSAGIPMAAWTVDEPSEAAELLAMGVPRITTNQVRRLVEWRSTLG